MKYDSFPLAEKKKKQKRKNKEKSNEEKRNDNVSQI